MSSGFGMSTILGCLAAGEDNAGLKPENWRAGPKGNLGQQMFVELQSKWRPGLDMFDKETLRSYASKSHADILAKMAEWKMRLDKLPDCGTEAIYMISQLREYMRWLSAGKKAMRDWPEFILDEGVSFFNVGGSEQLAVRVNVQGGDRVTFVSYDTPVDGMDLYSMVEMLEKVLWPSHQSTYSSVQIPCVYADLNPDMSWIVGMENDPYYIAYAQQKILFGMNDVGFAVREETGMVMRKGFSLRQPFILSPNGESFLMWRRRPGVEFPISLFQITQDDFKDPGDLGKIVE